MPDAPLDLDAMKEWFESTRKSAGPWWPLMHKMPALMAEVERLRAESVPRSALVQVGTGQQYVDGSWSLHALGHPRGRPIYVLREATE